MAATEIVTDPQDEPVSLDEQKNHMRVDTADDDDFIEELIVAARKHVEDITGLKLISQQWRILLDDYPNEDYMCLSFWPVISVDEIKTVDKNGTEAVFNSDSYITDTSSMPARIKLKSSESWPSPTAGIKEINAVEIKATFGYGDDCLDVPEMLKLAVRMLAAHWYENREATSILDLKPVPLAVNSLLANFRLYQREM
jgi:uncharacterized phiE125 gp8 family phage protein